ncbi:MAG: hypothetical protein KatS3mg068_0267 [Candidatus Sericytochromatia bacterium]|nr:MAG: hypothetical protein KatS3mg068_0267 [Candidatus Sericytochromatia bacterium]
MSRKKINIKDDILSLISNKSLLFFKKLYEIKSLEKIEEEIYFERQTVITSIRKLEKLLKNRIFMIKKNNIVFTEFGHELYQKIRLISNVKLNLNNNNKESINIIFDERILLFNDLLDSIYETISNFNVLINIDFKEEKFVLTQVTKGYYDIGLLLYNYLNNPKKNSKILVKDLRKINFFEVKKKNNKIKNLIFINYKKLSFEITQSMQNKFDYYENKHKSNLSTSDHELRVNFVKENLGQSIFIDKYSEFFDNSFYKNDYDIGEEGYFCLIANKNKIKNDILLFFIDEIKKIFVY